MLAFEQVIDREEGGEVASRLLRARVACASNA